MKYKHNQSYENIPDKNLIELLMMRLENENWSGRIDEVRIISKKNGLSTTEPFTVTFSVDSEFGNDKHSIIFKRFFINEFDYIHNLFDELHFLPPSEYIFKKKNEVTNLECSNRGWLSAAATWKKELLSIANNIGV